MLTLHIANKNYSSWSLRPWLVMVERGIPFEERLHVFDQDPTVNHHRFRAFSPSGKVPCLIDATPRPPLAVHDSLAIVEYVAEAFPSAGVWPTDRAARAFARSACAEMHAGFTGLRSNYSMNIGLRVAVHTPPPAAIADVARIAEIWTDGLTQFGGPYLAGAAFSAVDAFFAPVVFRFQTYGVVLPDASVGGPASTYQARMLALPSMQRWQAAALAEPYRDNSHEGAHAAFGTTTADLRAPAG